MRLTRRILLTAVAAPVVARAQGWPERVVRLVVPYPPGGSNDIVARLLAEALREQLGQPCVVENRAGAGGSVGADAVAKAAPDGHVLLLAAPGPLTTNDLLFSSLPYDPLRDLRAVALVATVPMVLLATRGLEVADVAGLIALAKRQPNGLSFGSSGNGSTNHLAGELFKAMAGVEMVHVPYRGAAPAMTDLIGGRVQVMFDNMPGVLPQLRGGQVRGLAVAGAARARAVPELPTVAESGLPGFEASSWFGLAAPAATPAAVVARINAAVLAALAMPALQARLAEAGAEPGALDAEATAAFVQAERAKWAAVIRQSGARAD